MKGHWSDLTPLRVKGFILEIFRAYVFLTFHRGVAFSKSVSMAHDSRPVLDLFCPTPSEFSEIGLCTTLGKSVSLLSATEVSADG